MVEVNGEGAPGQAQCVTTIPSEWAGMGGPVDGSHFESVGLFVVFPALSCPCVSDLDVDRTSVTGGYVSRESRSHGPDTEG